MSLHTKEKMNMMNYFTSLGFSSVSTVSKEKKYIFIEFYGAYYSKLKGGIDHMLTPRF